MGETSILGKDISLMIYIIKLPIYILYIKKYISDILILQIKEKQEEQK